MKYAEIECTEGEWAEIRRRFLAALRATRGDKPGVFQLTGDEKEIRDEIARDVLNLSGEHEFQWPER